MKKGHSTKNLRRGHSMEPSFDPYYGHDPFGYDRYEPNGPTPVFILGHPNMPFPHQAPHPFVHPMHMPPPPPPPSIHHLPPHFIHPSVYAAEAAAANASAFNSFPSRHHPHFHPVPPPHLFHPQFFPPRFGPQRPRSHYDSGHRRNSQDKDDESGQASGVIITEYDDDEDDEYEKRKNDKKKDYVDAVSLNEEEMPDDSKAVVLRENK